MIRLIWILIIGVNTWMFTKGNNLNSSIFKLSNSNDILKGFNINKDKTKGTVDVSNLDSNDIESYLKGYLTLMCEILPSSKVGDG